jgi:hypothetical protein
MVFQEKIAKHEEKEIELNFKSGTVNPAPKIKTTAFVSIYLQCKHCQVTYAAKITKKPEHQNNHRLE